MERERRSRVFVFFFFVVIGCEFIGHFNGDLVSFCGFIGVCYLWLWLALFWGDFLKF